MAPWRIKFDFLEKNNLSQYVNKFMELGYDDLKQLFDMQPEEIIDVLKEVALYDKPGHRKRNRNFEFEVDQTRSTG
jgi:hypothetical protein